MPGVAAVAPEVSTSQTVTAGTETTTTTIVGTTARVPGGPCLRGLAGQRADRRRASIAALRVAVLGKSTADDLGLGASAIGTEVRIGGIDFTVIGILQPKGGAGFQDPDDQVLVPRLDRAEVLRRRRQRPLDRRQRRRAPGR